MSLLGRIPQSTTADFCDQPPVGGDSSAVVMVELALWFKGQDRQSLLKALETEEDALTWAKRMIRGGGEILPAHTWREITAEELCQSWRGFDGNVEVVTHEGAMVWRCALRFLCTPSFSATCRTSNTHLIGTHVAPQAGER